LINSKIVGPTESRTSLRRRKGRLSEGQFVGRRCLTISEREERETGSNCSTGHRGGGGIGITEVWADLRTEILLVKKF